CDRANSASIWDFCSSANWAGVGNMVEPPAVGFGGRVMYRNLRHQLVRCTNRIVGAGKRMSSNIFASQQIMVMQAFKPNKSAICDLLPGLNGGPAWYLVPVGAGAKRAFGDDHHCGGAP
ncbi:MAG: hypothetical protein ACK540_16420, partial [Betaproteobacteria bacterium]